MHVRVTWGGNMFKNSKLASFPLAAVALLSGCYQFEDFEDLDSEEFAVPSRTLSPANPTMGSIVILNSLEPAALMPNDLGVRALLNMSPTTAALVRGPNGTLMRELLQYAVGCALEAQERIEVRWVDTSGIERQEWYSGQLGLAPNWRTRPLNVVEQEWVTACLAARTNWYAQPTRISMRGTNPALATANVEQSQYPVREGAFWGNLFAPVPYVRACYDPANVGYARSQGRECSAGHVEMGEVLECGLIHVVGSCDDACVPGSTAGYYSSCRAYRTALPNDTHTGHVITGFLR